MKKGIIKAYFGPMCSEKSLHLIKYNEKCLRQERKVFAFVPPISKDGSYIASRFTKNKKVKAKIIHNPLKIYQNLESHLYKCKSFSKLNGFTIDDYRITVLIDELQFFDDTIYPVLNGLRDLGLEVVVGYLDLNYRGDPFRLSNGKAGEGRYTMADITAISDERFSLHPTCSYRNDAGYICQNEATRTQRFEDKEHKIHSPYGAELVVVDPNLYVPRCAEHHIVPGLHNELETLLKK